jgi:P-type E1-E2 ATPase
VKVLRRTLLSETLCQDADPSELVPGDLIVLPKTNFVLPCDVVLLTGQCIVNESMLTGKKYKCFVLFFVSSVIKQVKACP